MSIGYVLETMAHQRRQARRRAGKRVLKLRFPSSRRPGSCA
jgi:hypothetical protein